MTLDIEHFVKVGLLSRVSQDPDEDGYSIVADFINGLNRSRREYLERELESRKAGDYTNAVATNYEGAMPIWVFIDVVSFGTLMSFLMFCSERWDDPKLQKEHYLLKSVKSLRNAAAHGVCLVNTFGKKERTPYRTPSQLSNDLSSLGIPKKLRSRHLRNLCVQQIACTVSLYSSKVPAGSSANRTKDALGSLYEAKVELAELIPDSNPAIAALSFVELLTCKFGVS